VEAPLTKGELLRAAEDNDAGTLCRYTAAKGDMGDVRNHERQTLVHVASKHGAADAIAILLQSAPLLKRIDARDRSRRTSLHLAAAMGFDECVWRLLESRAALDLQDERGCTPLHLAIRFDWPRTARVLLEARCDPWLKDSPASVTSIAAADYSTRMATTVPLGAPVQQAAMQKMRVAVPPGKMGGMPLQVQTPAGVMQVTIPEGKVAGDEFDMMVPSAPQAPPPAAPQPAQPQPQPVYQQAPQMAVQQPMVVQQQPQVVYQQPQVVMAPAPQVVYTPPPVYAPPPPPPPVVVHHHGRRGYYNDDGLATGLLGGMVLGAVLF